MSSRIGMIIKDNNIGIVKAIKSKWDSKKYLHQSVYININNDNIQIGCSSPLLGFHIDPIDDILDLVESYNVKYKICIEDEDDKDYFKICSNNFLGFDII